jgi:arsenate reductase (glutaredoxin)
MIQVYHNARCSKSRECLAFLDSSNTEYEVINYLETPPTVDELKSIIKKMGVKPIELVRQKEALWIEKFMDKKMTGAALIKAMVKYPVLIERPIAVNGDNAIIARPIASVQKII